MEVTQTSSSHHQTIRSMHIVNIKGWVVEVLRKYIRVKWQGGSRSRAQPMRLVETLSLGGKRQVILIDCGGQNYLVGCGAESVTSIMKVSLPIDHPRNTPKSKVQNWL